MYMSTSQYMCMRICVFRYVHIYFNDMKYILLHAVSLVFVFLIRFNFNCSLLFGWRGEVLLTNSRQDCIQVSVT